MKRTVTARVTGTSRSYGTPFEYWTLQCGHAVKAEAGLEVGGQWDCRSCDDQARAVAKLREALSGGAYGIRISHSRVKPWAGINVVHVYQFDDTSPSGVRLFASVEDSAEVIDLLTRASISPLSPTEPR